MMKRSKINKRYLLTGTVAVLALGVCLFVLVPASNQTLPDTQDNILIGEKISGLPKDTVTTIEYISGNQIESAQIHATSDGGFVYQPTDSFLNKENQYTVKFAAHLPDDSYIDVNMKINKQANKIAVDIAGLEKQSAVSLSVGGFEYYSNIPVDWAGRLALNTNNLKNLDKSNICLTAASKTQNTPSVICHSVIERTGGQTS